MDIREFSDDFFSVGKISILDRTTYNDRYDYNFRNNFDCRSIVSETKNPVLLHIGAIEDYDGIETYLEENGMKLLIHKAEHLRCSTIEKWYPSLKEKTPFTIVYDELPPISYEFRFFYFEGKCMGYGPYWYMGHSYTMLPEDVAPALELADWAAERLMVSFPAIDLAKTASGEWIIIAVNDAQESGFVGLNPIPLWKNTINAMQERNWILVEELFPVMK